MEGAQWLGKGSWVAQLRRLRQRYQMVRLARQERVHALRPVLQRQLAAHETRERERLEAMARVRRRGATIRLRAAVKTMEWARKHEGVIPKSENAAWARNQLARAGAGAVRMAARDRQLADALNDAGGGMRFAPVSTLDQRSHLDKVRRMALGQVPRSGVSL